MVSKPGPETIYPAYVVGDSENVVEQMSSNGGEVAAASGGRDADSPAYSRDSTRACGIGTFAQIFALGAADIGAAASAGIHQT